MVENLKSFVNSAGFNRFILAMIVLSGVLVGMETYPEFSNTTPAGRIVDMIQSAILWIFAVEAALKIASYWPRPLDYFRQGWNVFDFIIIVICFLPIHMAYASVFRLARILRTLRMITVLPKLQVLVGALLKSIPSLGYIGVLLSLHFYVYAVVGTSFFGKNDPRRFGNLHETTLTLFQTLTLEGWNDILHTEYYGSDLMYDDDWKEKTKGIRESQPQPIIASIYFVTFILLGTMIMLNLFTGVIISSMEEAQEETKGETREEHLKERGFLTLNDELGLLHSRLEEITAELKRLQAMPTDRPSM